MKIGRTLFGFGEGLLDRVLCVVGTVLFAQVPEFLQQYLQRLGGHLDEARRQLAQFRHVAEQSGLSLDRLITQTNTNPDPAVVRLSEVIAGSSARVDALTAAQAALEHASGWTRPFVFLRHVEPAIVHATWHAFQPAVPTTLEGLVYAVVGMLVLLGLYHAGIKYPIAKASRLRRETLSARSTA